MMPEYPLIGDVRGRGLMVGVELVRDRQTKERATTERDRIVQEMFKRGVLILGAGRNAIRFAPPLVITKAQIDVIVDTFRQALDALKG
jgi:4-aminobutyrate aminotransferase